MANIYVDEDAVGRDPNTRVESSNSGQPSPKFLVRGGASGREAFTTTNRRNCGGRLGVMSQKCDDSLQNQ